MILQDMVALLTNGPGIVPVPVPPLLPDGSSLVLGTNLFYGRMPPTPDTCVALFEAPGNSYQSLGGGPSVYEAPKVTVMTRATDYDTARLLIERVKHFFDALPYTSIDGIHIMDMDVDSTPLLAPPDEKDRWLFVTTLTCWKEPSTI
jgi:hypothetical protein